VHRTTNRQNDIGLGPYGEEWIAQTMRMLLGLGGVYHLFRLSIGRGLGYSAVTATALAVYVLLLGLALARPRAPILAACVVAGMGITSGLAIVQEGFAGVTAILLVTTPVLVTLLYGARISYYVIVGELIAFVAIGALHATGHLVSEPGRRIADPNVFVNWIRIGMVLCSVTLPVAWLASRVTSHLERSLADLVRAEALHDAQKRLRVTAEQALSEAVEGLDKSRRLEAAGLLIGTVVHDFRNALGALQMWSGALAKHEATTAAVRESSGRIHGWCSEAVRVTADIMAVIRPSETGSTDCLAYATVESAVAVLRRVFPEDVALHVDCEVESSVRVGVGSSVLTSVVSALAADVRFDGTPGRAIRFVIRYPDPADVAVWSDCGAVIDLVLDPGTHVVDDPALVSELAEHGIRWLSAADCPGGLAARLLLPLPPAQRVRLDERRG
jgi:hypothetical protein